MLAVDIAETVFEPRVGGHIYDRGVDGSECRWARVLAYEPPDRVVFSWDISPHWQLEDDPERASEVEVRFVAETPERTRVELEHRDLDRHGEGWEGLRAGVEAPEGWPLYLNRYAEAVTRAEPEYIARLGRAAEAALRCLLKWPLWRASTGTS